MLGAGTDVGTLLVTVFLVALLPSVVLLGTSYLKISVVLGMLRNALGTQQVPGGVVNLTLALGMSCFVMEPVVRDGAAVLDGVLPKVGSSSSASDALKVAGAVTEPWVRFLDRNSGTRERAVLERIVADGKKEQGEVAARVVVEDKLPPLRIALGAFVLTELREAFLIGFVLLLPFLAIDLVVANLLVGMGMFMLSPMVITLPLKLLLFVMADGWMLLTQSLLLSYLV